MNMTTWKWRPGGATFALVAVLASGCGSEDESARLTSISVNPATASAEVGATQAFHAVGRYSDGRSADVTAQAQWTSSDTAVATVGASNGTARGVGAGQSTITATLGAYMGHATLTVSTARVYSVTITPQMPMDLPIGMTRAFTATGTHLDGTTVDLTADPHLFWQSSMPAVATISSADGTRGVATGVSEGATSIGATYDDQRNPAVNATAVALHVVRSPLTALSIEPASPIVPRGYTLQLRLVGTYADAHVEDLTGDARTVWASASAATATVSNDTGSRGLVTGAAAGDVAITATVGSVTTTANLHVTDAALSSIAVVPSAVTVTRGGSVRLRAIGAFSDLTTMDLSDVVMWETQDAARAAVSNARGTAGVVTVPDGAAPGPVIITARRGSISSTATVTVNTALTLRRLDVSVDQALIPAGLTARATAVGTYTDGVITFARDVTEQVTWSATGMATISNASGSRGLITATTAGAASIGATLSGVMATAVPVTVTGCALNALRIAEGESLSMARGTSRRLTARSLYDTAAAGCESLGSAYYDVTEQPQTVWSSTNTAVLTVGNTAGSRGLVIAAASPAAPATADVQVRFGALMTATRVSVTEACVRAIAITASSDVMPAGVELAFRAIATMSDGGNRDVSVTADWVSSDNAVASVAPHGGTVHANRAGTTTIRAQVPVAARCAGATEGSFALTVNDATVTGVSVEPSSQQISRGERVQLRATGTFSDMRQFDLTPVATWSSSNGAVATVSGGLVQANAANDGTAIVTAAFGARDGFSSITVSGARLQRITVGVAPSYSCGTNAMGAYPVGATVPLVATGFFSDMSSRPLYGAVWTSDSPVVTVDRFTGRVSTLGAGNGRVRAWVGAVQSEVITVSAAAASLTGIQVSPPSGWEIPLGSDQQFTATGVFQGFDGACPITERVTWTASVTAPATLSIGGDGFAHAGTTGAGAASVRAAMGAVSAVSAGSVRGACVNGLTVELPAASSAVGVHATALAYLTYSDGSRALVSPEWSTDQEALARVFNATDPFGRPVGDIVPRAVGRATITARVTPSTGAACAGQGPTFTGTASFEVTSERVASISVDCASDPVTNRCNFGDSAAPSYPAGVPFACRAYAQGTGGSRWDVTSSVAWSSSNPSVVEVSDAAGSRGLARGNSAGMGVVVATAGSVSGSRTVTVHAATLQAIDVSPRTLSLPVGFTQRLQAEGTFAAGLVSRRCSITQWATWTSSDPQGVTVGNAGAYRGVAWMLRASATPVTVSAAFLGRSGAATVVVNSATLAAITVVPPAAQTAVGQTATFSATGRYSDGSSRDITDSARWSTGDSRIAVVSNAFLQRGIARALAQGTTVVRAEVGGLVSEAQLTITSACVQRVTITVKGGGNSRPSRVPMSFTAYALYSNGYVGDVTGAVQWASSDEAVSPAPSNVDGDFVVITRAPGAATISAAMAGCSGTVTGRLPLTVTAATLRSIEVHGASGTSATPVNLTVRFRAFGAYSDGTQYDITAAVDSWSLGNTSVAVLSGDGYVAGRAVGTSTLTATQGTVSGATMVTVTAATLLSVRVVALDLADACRDPADPASYVSASRAPVSTVGSLRAYGTYSDQVVRDLTDQAVWSSDNDAVAVVFNVPAVRGMVFHRAAGSTRLRASVDGVNSAVSGDVALEVRAGTLASLALNPGAARPLTIARGNRARLALVGDYGAAGRYCVGGNASWSSTDAAVASVDRGTLDALGTGTATVTASVGTLNDTLVVTVGAPTLSYVELAPRALSLTPFSTARLRALAHYSDGTVDDVSGNPSTLWSATDLTGMGVVWIDPGLYERGLVWALRAGEARVDACVGAVCARDGDRAATVTVAP